MGSIVLEQLRNSALDLPEKERAELAHDILASLDGPADDGVRQAWATEIERRIAEIDAGHVDLVEADEVMRRVLKRTRRPQ